MKRSVVARVWWEESRQSTEDSQGSGNTLTDAITVVDTCHYAFAQTHRMYNARVSLMVNYAHGY